MILSKQPFTIVASITAIVFLICLIFTLRLWKKLKFLRNELINYRLGFDGERYVASELAPLAAKGYHTFHDFIYDMNGGGEETNFNIDHIVVGPEGVFLIETKAKRKSLKAPKNDLANHEISVEGDTEANVILRFADDTTTDEPIKQALRQAKSLETWIKKSNIELKVRPVLVYPGWYIKSKHGSLSSVQSAKNIATNLPKLGIDRKLSSDEIAQIAARIEDKCRNVEGSA